MAEIELTKEEEKFLIEAEKEDGRLPVFDALAMRQIGLSLGEVQVVQTFFMKARAFDFNVRKHTKSECLLGLISALRYLPRTDTTGTITLASYKRSDNIYHENEKWSGAFRHEFGHALLMSHKEKMKPLLLEILQKVYAWIVAFQETNGIFQELPQWLQDGMAGNFKSDSWIGSDLYEGDKDRCFKEKASPENYQHTLAPVITTKQTSGRQATLFSENMDKAGGLDADDTKQQSFATDKQKEFLKRLLAKQGIDTPGYDIDGLTKTAASLNISELLKGGELR